MVSWTPGILAQSANVCSGSSSSPSPPEKTIAFPFADVHRGLCGVAYTVFEGVTPEPMQVEILGILKNSRGPGQDMILARLHGLMPEYTGVVAGMSGSPVYIDGKLVGALSFRIGQFSKEPIAGITPIAEMLAIGEAGQPTSADQTIEHAAPSDTLGVAPIDTALVFNGFNSQTVDRFADNFRALGLSPVAGLGAASSDLRQPEPLVPGSAVSAILVRGDFSVAGTCTVSYVDKSKLLACGHPITQFGQISFPMTKATVLATLPSPLNAFKIIATTETVGEFTEDRNAAILGRFNESARMISVHVDITGESSAHVGPPPHKQINFEVVDNKELTPSLMLVSIFQSMQQTNLASAEASYKLAGELTIAGQAPVKLDGVIAPTDLNPAAIGTALFVNERFARIYGNTVSRPIITGLNLSLSSVGPDHSAILEYVRTNRNEVTPGETIEIEATIHPVRSMPVTLRIPITIPADTAPGDLRLLVGDGATTDRTALPLNATLSSQPIALPDVIGQLNRIHHNDSVYVTLLAHDAQAVLDGATLSSIPLSTANVYESQRSEQKIQIAGESAEELGSANAGFAVTGAQVLTLKIK